MNSHKLRIYDHSSVDMTDSLGKNAIFEPVQLLNEPRVRVSVAQVLPLLADALASQRLWLQDFHDDSLTISQDLFEVLLAYQRLCNSAAA